VVEVWVARVSEPAGFDILSKRTFSVTNARDQPRKARRRRMRRPAGSETRATQTFPSRPRLPCSPSIR